MDTSLNGQDNYKSWDDSGKKNDGDKAVEHTFINGAKVMLYTGPLNILLLATPIALISYAAGWDDAVTFIFSLLALAPLAERLGFVTEQLAIHTNETIGGLLNATFGNATELIVAISALAKGLYRLVQLSLLGSILSNMLLVLGTAFFFGGLKNETQTYGKISSQVNATLLMLSTMALLFPTALSNSGKESKLGELGFSRGTSIILVGIYIAFLVFQLKTHKHLYDEAPKPSTPSSESLIIERSSESPIISATSHQLQELSPSSTAQLEANITKPPAPAAADDDDEEEEDLLGFNYSLFWLTAITVVIAFLSEAISDSIQDAASSVGISGIFLAAIVLPIVGNAAEHAGAVMFAWKGKVDLTLGVAIGSSTQIAVFVLPLLVILGWMADKDMSLNFGSYEAICLLATVISVTFAIKDGTSNWLVGIVLIAAYFIIALGFWSHVDDDLSS